MSFNYEQIPYGVIKTGAGEELNKKTEIYKWLEKATHEDKRLSDTVVRCGEKEKLYSQKICWDERVVQTLTAKKELFRGDEKTTISKQDIIHAQTFPEDYDFIDHGLINVFYVCGMSVPPVMIKRIVMRLIEEGVFNYKLDTSTP